MGRFLDRGARQYAGRQAARPPLLGPRMAGRRLLSRAARRLPPRLAAIARCRLGRRRARQRQGDDPLPARPISERRQPEQLRHDQSRRGQAHQGNRRREPGPGVRPFHRGSVERQGHRPTPHRSDRVRKGQNHRRDAGRGGVRKCAVPVDPVHPDDAQGRRRAVALRPAAGEPLLHDRPRAAPKPGQMAGRRRPHRVRRQLGQSRARAQGPGRRGLCAGRRGRGDRSGRQAHQGRARPVRLLPRRDIGRDRAGVARRQGPRQRRQFGDVDRLTRGFRRHARLVGVRP